jgi:hypothetical protein
MSFFDVALEDANKAELFQANLAIPKGIKLMVMSRRKPEISKEDHINLVREVTSFLMRRNDYASNR